jgi:hypothetical protein
LVTFRQDVELRKRRCVSIVNDLCPFPTTDLQPSTYLLSSQIQPHPMVLADGMSICPTTPSSALEVLATYQTTVHVDVGHRFRAEALEVKFQVLTGDLRKAKSKRLGEMKRSARGDSMRVRTVSRYMSPWLVSISSFSGSGSSSTSSSSLSSFSSCCLSCVSLVPVVADTPFEPSTPTSFDPSRTSSVLTRADDEEPFDRSIPSAPLTLVTPAPLGCTVPSACAAGSSSTAPVVDVDDGKVTGSEVEDVEGNDVAAGGGGG